MGRSHTRMTYFVGTIAANVEQRMPLQTRLPARNGEIDTESDLCASCRFSVVRSALVMVHDFEVARVCVLFFRLAPSSEADRLEVLCAKDVGTAALRGVPGDVGGRARGAELMECAPRLWP